MLSWKLLEPWYHEVKPGVKFLETFSGVVGSKWPSLAASLSMSGEEIEDMRKKGYTVLSECYRSGLQLKRLHMVGSGRDFLHFEVECDSFTYPT